MKFTSSKINNLLLTSYEKDGAQIYSVVSIFDIDNKYDFCMDMTINEKPDQFPPSFISIRIMDSSSFYSMESLVGNFILKIKSGDYTFTKVFSSKSMVVHTSSMIGIFSSYEDNIEIMNNILSYCKPMDKFEVEFEWNDMNLQ